MKEQQPEEVGVDESRTNKGLETLRKIRKEREREQKATASTEAERDD